jgi:serine/threonine protein kinase/Flp pilus assembly protein TadD
MQLGVARRGGTAPAPAPAPEAEGPVPGYRLIERIGIGGSGEVWAAEGPGGFAAALKFVRLPAGPRDVDLRAIEILREVRHPNLLAGFGSWLVDGILILAMERADGSLWDRALEAVGSGRPGIPRDELVGLMADAARGVDFLNEHRHVSGDRKGLGIQHCDLKPQNILLVGGGVKVADFGAARWMGEAITGISGKNWTPAYAPPEFFVGVVTRHSDQYSLAVTYCQLRGGRFPFVGDAPALMTGHVMHPPDLSMLDEPERPAVARALAKLPEDRWPDCRSFFEALRADIAAPDIRPAQPQVVASEEKAESKPEPTPALSVMAPTPIPWTPPIERPRGRPGIAAAALLVMGGLALWASGFLREKPRASARRVAGTGPGPIARSDNHVVRRFPAPPPAPPEAVPDDPEPDPWVPDETAWDAPPDAAEVAEVVAFTPPSPDVTGAEGPSRPAVASTPYFKPIAAEIPPPREAAEVEASRKASPPPLLARSEVVAPAEARPEPTPAPAAIPAPEPTPPAAHEAKCRGDAHMIRGEQHSAIAAYTEAIRNDPADAGARYGRSRAFAALGDKERAIDDLDEVIRLRHDDVRAIADRGVVRYEQGRLDHAIADFDAVLRLAPWSAVAHYNRGRIYALVGDTDEALAEYAASLRIDPGYALALKARDETRARRVDRARAQAKLVRGSWLKSPSNPPPPPVPSRITPTK